MTKIKKNNKKPDIYKSVLDSFPGGIMLLKPLPNIHNVTDLKIIDINPAFEEQKGISRNEIKGELASEVYPQMIKKQRLKIYSSLVKNGYSSSFREFNRRLNKWYTVTAVYDPVTKLITMIFSSDRNPAPENYKEELKKSEERFSTAFRTNPNAIIITTISNGILEVNDSFLNLFGLTRKEVIGQDSVTLNLLPDPQKRDEVVELIRKDGYVRNFEVLMKSRKGELKTVLISIDKMPMSQGDGYLTVFQDITDQRKYEVSRAAQEQQYRILAENLELERSKLAATIDNLPVGVGIEDPSGDTTFMNKAGLALHGFSSEEEMYSALKDYIEHFEITYPDGRLMPVEEWPVSRALRGEYVENYELILKNKKTGTEKILSYTVVPVTSPELGVALYVYVFRDLTNIKKAEQDLRESEEKFRTLADNISQLAWMADKSGKAFWLNKRWYEYTGLDHEVDSNTRRLLVQHPDHMERVVKKFNESIAKGEEWEDTFPLRSKTGEYRWFLSRATPVYNNSGEIIRWFGTNTDITEQKKLEDELSSTLKNLEEHKSQLLSAQKLAKMGSFETFPDKGHMLWSDTLYDIFERHRSSGDPSWSELIENIHPEDRNKVQESFDTAVKRNDKTETELRIVFNEERIKHLYLVLSPMYDELSGQRKFLGAVMDITERKVARIKLEAAYSQIGERLNEKEVLLKELYHRTKNNMQVISSLLGLKTAAFGSSDPSGVIEDMQKRIRSIALVHEKLYQSQNLSRVNLGEYIIDLTRLLLESHRPDESNIQVSHELENIRVSIDAAVPCGLIITELVLNSLKHAFPGGRKGYIEIKLKREQDNLILLSVADNGVGLNKDYTGQDETLGLKLFRNIAENQLEALVNLDISNGTKWELRFSDQLYDERI